MRSRLLGATVAGLLVVCIAAACDPSDEGAAETLAPIITTTSTSTTLAPPTTVPRFYEIQPGDTLTEIADAFGLPIVAIMEANGITDQDKIQAGQILQLPPEDIVADALPAGASTTVTTTSP